MIRLKTLTLLMCMSCTSCVQAQMKGLHFNFSTEPERSSALSGVLKSDGMPVLRTVTPLSFHMTSFEYNQQIPKGAVFCRLENHLCEHYNIWLKIRAGDVEEYHRQIEKKQ